MDRVTNLTNGTMAANMLRLAAILLIVYMIGPICQINYTLPARLSKKNAVARLCSDLGIAIEMTYGCDVSYVDADEKAIEAFSKYFKYKDSVYAIYSYDYYDVEDFVYKLMTEVHQNRPCLLGLLSSYGYMGHVVVADGYINDYNIKIHLNFGWGGGYDGWYTSDDIPWYYDIGVGVLGIEPKITTYTLQIYKAGSGDGSISPGVGTHTYSEGTTVNLTASPYANSTFGGWSGDASGSSQSIYLTMNSNKTVTAAFNIKTFVINASSGANGSISPSGSISVNYGSSKAFSITPNSGYHVEDVLVDGIYVGPKSSYIFNNITKDHTIHATFEMDLPKRTLTVSKTGDGEGTVTPGVGQHIYDHGTTVNLNASPATSSVFIGWSGEASGTNPNTSILMDADKTVTAGFNLKTLTISASAAGNGVITPSGNIPVKYGQNKSFTITANPGTYTSDVLVDGISIGTPGSYTFNNVTTDRSIQAIFQNIPTYTISASAGTGGTISPSGDIIVQEGENGTFQITPNEGYYIADVVVDGASIGAVDSYTFFDVTDNHSIGAFFEIFTYSIVSGFVESYFHVPGDNPRGLTYDGNYLWLVERDEKKVYQLDFAGNVLDSFPTPGEGPAGIAFKDDSFWLSDDADDLVYKLNIFGTVIDTFSSPGAWPAGLSHDGSYLWHADQSTKLIYQLDASGNTINSFGSPGNGPFGLVNVGGFVWHTDWTKDKIYKLNTAGAVLESQDAPVLNPVGLTFDGSNFWIVDDVDDIVLQFNNEPKGNINPPGRTAVSYGDDISLDITPNPGYIIRKCLGGRRIGRRNPILHISRCNDQSHLLGTPREGKMRTHPGHQNHALFCEFTKLRKSCRNRFNG